MNAMASQHDDIIKWKHFPRYWLFVRGIHRSSVNSPHKVQWRGALMFSLIWAWTNGRINNCEAGDLIRHCSHYDATVMNHRRLGSLFSRLFRHRSNKTSNLRVTGLCHGTSPVTGEFPWQRASILRGKCFHWWSYHDTPSKKINVTYA